MKEVSIIGAGMAGLLAARLLKSKASVKVFARQETLPHNHNAVLRFRTNAVSEATGIEFRKVNMVRTSINHLNPVAASLSYSFKCNGTAASDRSIGKGTVEGERYIAPEDFIRKLASTADIQYSTDITEDLGKVLSSGGRPAITISTVPMPVLMLALEYPGRVDVTFGHRKGSVVKATLANTDAFVSLYDPRPWTGWSRASITGCELSIEFPMFDAEHVKLDNRFWDDLMSQLGLSADFIISKSIEIKSQTFAKISPIDNERRLAFIHWATDKFSIYSLGRFATWRPGLLLDDLVNDIKLIDRWTDRKSMYDVVNHR